MDRDQLWKALFLPGLATDYFEFNKSPAFQPDVADYLLANALFLAELCRWAYNIEDETARSEVSDEPLSNSSLEKIGLQESRHFLLEAAQASLVRSQDRSFHILVFRGALATLTASLRAPRALYTFGCPRVGNRAFAEELLHVPIHRVVNRKDVVPSLPLPGGPFDYKHAGNPRRLGKFARWNLLRLLAGLRMLWHRRKFVLERFLQSENLFNPPAFLMDHAPLNYVRRLEHDWLKK